jgi:hypothetical protein
MSHSFSWKWHNFVLLYGCIILHIFFICSLVTGHIGWFTAWLFEWHCDKHGCAGVFTVCWLMLLQVHNVGHFNCSFSAHKHTSSQRTIVYPHSNTGVSHYGLPSITDGDKAPIGGWGLGQLWGTRGLQSPMPDSECSPGNWRCWLFCECLGGPVLAPPMARPHASCLKIPQFPHL